MSFGLRDQDWVDPPEEDFEADWGELEIKFNKTPIFLDIDEMYMEFLDKDLFDDKYYDEDYISVPLADGDDVEVTISEYLFDKFNEDDEKSGNYFLSGWVSIPYTVWAPITRGKFFKHEDDYYELMEQAEIEVHWDDMTCGGLKLDV